MKDRLNFNTVARDFTEWCCVKLAQASCDVPVSIIHQHPELQTASYTLMSEEGDPFSTLVVQTRNDPFAVLIGPPIYNGRLQEILVVRGNGTKTSKLAYVDGETDQFVQQDTSSNSFLRIWNKGHYSWRNLVQDNGRPDNEGSERTLFTISKAYQAMLRYEKKFKPSFRPNFLEDLYNIPSKTDPRP